MTELPPDPIDLPDLQQSLSLISRSHHTSLIKLLGASLSGSYVYLVYEYLFSGYLLARKLSPLTTSFISSVPSWISQSSHLPPPTFSSPSATCHTLGANLSGPSSNFMKFNDAKSQEEDECMRLETGVLGGNSKDDIDLECVEDEEDGWVEKKSFMSSISNSHDPHVFINDGAVTENDDSPPRVQTLLVHFTLILKLRSLKHFAFRASVSRASPSGVTGEATRHGSDDTARRPPSVKAALSVSFGQRAPHRASTRDSSPVRRTLPPPPPYEKTSTDDLRSRRSQSRDYSDRDYSDRDRDRDRGRDRDWNRERDRDSDRDRERYKERERGRDRDRSRDRERSSDYDRRPRYAERESRRDYYESGRDGGRVGVGAAVEAGVEVVACKLALLLM
ncbi:hypothetical protein ACLB2K_022570 [Fragaria x ananassa]